MTTLRSNQTPVKIFVSTGIRVSKPLLNQIKRTIAKGNIIKHVRNLFKSNTQTKEDNTIRDKVLRDIRI